MSMPNATITFPILGEGFALNFSNHFEIFGRTLYWYGAIVALGFILGSLYIMKQSKNYGIKEDDAIDMILFTVPAALIGARLYYVVFNWSMYKDDLSGIYKVWEGGLAIYGGIIAGIITIFLVCRHKKIKPLALLDVSALGVMIGQMIGRWGNFANREAFGTSENVDTFFLRMGLTQDGVTTYVHPTFLYESVWNLIGFIWISIFARKKRKYDGQIMLMYILWYGVGRFFIEGLRTDSLYLFGTDLRVSQLLAIISAGTAAVLLMHFSSKKLGPDALFVNTVKEHEAELAEAEVEETAEEAEDEEEYEYVEVDEDGNELISGGDDEE